MQIICVWTIWSILNIFFNPKEDFFQQWLYSYHTREYLSIYTIAHGTQNYVPNLRGAGILVLVSSCRRRHAPPGPNNVFPGHYFVNQWVDFDQTCIDTVLGGIKGFD